MTLRLLTFTALFSSLATVGVAQDPTPLRGDVTAFETCFIQLLLDNPDNFMTEMIGPAICGERHIPMGQTCDALGYMLFDRRSACKRDDLVFWQAQVDLRTAAAIADGRSGVGAMYTDGLERCDEVAGAGNDPLSCLIELHWRTALEFIAADLVSDLAGAKQ